MGIEALLLSQVITITGSTGQVVTKQADGSLALEDAAGGGLDNLTEAFATASPNNVVNNVSLTATGPTTNVSVAIVPKGTGAFSLAVPDGTAAGGNARGENAVDLQTNRGNANQVASGISAMCVGFRNRASGNASVALGADNVASGAVSTVIGQYCSASGQESLSGVSSSQSTGVYAISLGRECMSSARAAFAIGEQSVADRSGQSSRAAGRFAVNGDAQSTTFVVRNKTTNATPTTLFLNGTSTRLTIPSGKILFADILISGIKSDGTAAATYKRKTAIKNVAGTTTLVGSVETIGTDHEDSAATDVAITADGTNNALQINVTGIAAETWRWVAVVEGLEIAYGT